MEDRFTRLEQKVDNVKDEVSLLKTDFTVHTHLVENKLELFEEHITGDTKIINTISPVVERLPEILEVVEDYKYEMRKKRERDERRAALSTKVRIIGGIIAASATILGLLATFNII